MDSDLDDSFEDFLRNMSARRPRAKSHVTVRSRKTRKAASKKPILKTVTTKQRRLSTKSLPANRRPWRPSVKQKCTFSVNQHQDISKLKLETRRQRRQIHVLTKSRSAMKLRFKTVVKQLKSEKQETKFWINKAEHALKRVQKMKKFLQSASKQRRHHVRRSKLYRHDEISHPKPQKFNSTTQTFDLRYISSFDQDEKENERFKSLENKLQTSFQNYRALKSTNKKLLVELRRSRRETFDLTRKIKAKESEMQNMNIVYRELQRTMQLKELKQNAPNIEKRLTKHTKKEVDFKTFLNENEAEKKLDFQCKIRKQEIKRSKLHSKNSKESEINLMEFDKLNKLRRVKT